MKKTLLALLILCSVSNLTAQDEGDDLLAELGSEPTVDYTAAAFKTTRVVNGHSIENAAPGVLDMKISHRFAPIRQGFYDIFGLDGATIRIGLDYGISERLMIGGGRSSKEKIYDGFAKYKLLRQSTGKRKMPVSLSYVADYQIKSEKFDDPNRDNKISSRVYYTHQLILARKFNDRLSLQLMPTLVHRNLVATRADKNDVLTLGAAGRIKLTKRTSFNAEYYYVLPDQLPSTPYQQSLSIGFDIETGGHVFQLHFTNAQDMTYKGFITETHEPWLGKDAEGDLMTGVRFGFNVSRVFTVRKPKDL